MFEIFICFQNADCGLRSVLFGFLWNLSYINVAIGIFGQQKQSIQKQPFCLEAEFEEMTRILALSGLAFAVSVGKFERTHSVLVFESKCPLVNISGQTPKTKDKSTTTMIILHLLVRLDGKNYEIITIVYTYFNGK